MRQAARPRGDGFALFSAPLRPTHISAPLPDGGSFTFWPAWPSLVLPLAWTARESRAREADAMELRRRVSWAQGLADAARWGGGAVAVLAAATALLFARSAGGATRRGRKRATAAAAQLAAARWDAAGPSAAPLLGEEPQWRGPWRDEEAAAGIPGRPRWDSTWE